MNKTERIIVVGGVAGGSTAATRLRRLNEHAQIILFERGNEISFANCGMPYYIGGVIPNRKSLLLQTSKGMKTRYNIDVFVNTEVISINKNEKYLTVKNLTDEETRTEHYDKLILSPGAKPNEFKNIHADGNRIFTLRSIPDMDAISEVIKSAKNAIVIGGGFIGIELAENIRKKGLDVTLLEAAPQIAGFVEPEFANVVAQAFKENGISVHCNAYVNECIYTDNAVCLSTSAGDFTADVVFLCVGITAESDLAIAADIQTSPSGGIITSPEMRTSDPDIYALGDAAQIKHLVSGQPVMVPLASPANKQARISANNIAGRNSTFKGVLGTSILKAFDKTVASTGLNEKQLKLSNIDYQKIYVHGGSHADYYPGATQMCIKLMFNPNGKILGAQISGETGVSKRIDVIATAISLGANVYQLAELELSYAPPFGSAKDPINVAGYVACNVLDGLLNVFHIEDLPTLPDDSYLVDVRTQREYSAGTIGDAINIPVDELRNRLAELPRDNPIYIFCAVGLRGYLASRILLSNGYTQVSNLSGGYRLYQQATSVV